MTNFTTTFHITTGWAFGSTATGAANRMDAFVIITIIVAAITGAAIA